MTSDGPSTRRSKLLLVSLPTPPACRVGMHTDISALLSGPLAYAFPLLSLRTNKADVVVGIPSSVAEALDARDEKWRINGRYVRRIALVNGFWNVSIVNAHADMPLFRLFRARRSPIHETYALQQRKMLDGSNVLACVLALCTINRT